MPIWWFNNTVSNRSQAIRSYRTCPEVALAAAILSWTCAAAIAGPTHDQSVPKQTYSSEVEKFCLSVGDRASDARFAWQVKELTELDKKVTERLELLQARISEYKKWLTLRKNYSDRVRQGLIEIYRKMPDEAASDQLSVLDKMTAAALISKLPARKASTILATMDAKKAAVLVSIMRSSADTKTAARAK